MNSNKIVVLTVILGFIIVCTTYGQFPFTVPDNLPAPTGNVYEVEDAARLLIMLTAGAEDNMTIILNEGEYNMGQWSGQVVIDKDNVTLRGKTMEPEKYVLLGKGFKDAFLGDELIKLAAENTTIAYLTMKDVRSNALKIQSGANHNLLVHNVRFIDVCERGIKGPGGVPISNNVEVRYCHFENVTPITSDIPNLAGGGEYVRGMDIMQVNGLHIHHNVFKNITGMGHSAGTSFSIWGGRDGMTVLNVVVENNLIIGCDIGMRFGLPGGLFCIDTMICRNNFVMSSRVPLEIANSDHVEVYYNTFHQPNALLYALQLTSNRENVAIKNNIFIGRMAPTSSTPDTAANLWVSDTVDEWFADAATGDLHLTANATEAIDAGVVLSAVNVDWDGEERGGSPDIGADEFFASGIRNFFAHGSNGGGIRVWPNPFSVSTSIVIGKQLSVNGGTVQILDIAGRLLQTIPITAHRLLESGGTQPATRRAPTSSG